MISLVHLVSYPRVCVEHAFSTSACSRRRRSMCVPCLLLRGESNLGFLRMLLPTYADEDSDDDDELLHPHHAIPRSTTTAGEQKTEAITVLSLMYHVRT